MKYYAMFISVICILTIKPLYSTIRPMVLTQDKIDKNASIVKSDQKNWTITKTILNKGEHLTNVYFLDAKTGWVSGKGSGLYHTNNAGGNWERLLLNLPEGSQIRSFCFISQLKGWLVYQPISYSLQQLPTYNGKLLSTSDGGKHWASHSFDDSIGIERVFFIDENEGWIVGKKYSHALVLYTTDGGKTWTDLSVSVRQVIGNPGGAIDIVSLRKSQAYILLINGYILETTDKGHNWTVRGNASSAALINYFIMQRIKYDKNNNVFAVGSYDHPIEGIGSVFINVSTTLRQEIFLLNGKYIMDIVPISSDLLLACGRMPASKEGTASNIRNGVILYSNNNGKTWDILHKDEHNIKKGNLEQLILFPKSINALTAVDSSHIWAVGNQGQIIHLARLE